MALSPGRKVMIIVICVAIPLILWLFVNSTESGEHFSQELRESAPQFVADMKEAGLVYDINLETVTMLVDPALWSRMPIDQKEKAATIFAAYFEHRGRIPHANIKDKFSGRKLCEYTWGWGLSCD